MLLARGGLTKLVVSDKQRNTLFPLDKLGNTTSAPFLPLSGKIIIVFVKSLAPTWVIRNKYLMPLMLFLTLLDFLFVVSDTFTVAEWKGKHMPFFMGNQLFYMIQTFFSK